MAHAFSLETFFVCETQTTYWNVNTESNGDQGWPRPRYCFVQFCFNDFRFLPDLCPKHSFNSLALISPSWSLMILMMQFSQMFIRTKGILFGSDPGIRPRNNRQPQWILAHSHFSHFVNYSFILTLALMMLSVHLWQENVWVMWFLSTDYYLYLFLPWKNSNCLLIYNTLELSFTTGFCFSWRTFLLNYCYFCSLFTTCTVHLCVFFILWPVKLPFLKID